MQDLGMAAALFLAGVFAWAGAVKAVSPASSAASFRRLGLPWAGLLSRVVPLVELSTAILLVVAPTAGAAAAIVLLAGFDLVVLRALSQGRTAGCGCFGASNRAEPLSWIEPLRNSLLMVLAAMATAAGSTGLPHPTALASVGAAAAAGALVLGLARLKVRVGAVWATPLPGSLPTR